MQEIFLNQYTCIVLLILFIIIFAALNFIMNMEDIPFFKKKGDVIDFIGIGMAQYIGTREKQDDSFDSQRDGNMAFAIVADGIGGFMDGDMASRIAVDTFMENYRHGNVRDNINYFFNSSAMSANEKIRRKFQDTPCGTTVVAALVVNKKLYFMSVGDSIIAVFRNGRLIPVNTKQNVENWLEEQYIYGKISREQALGSKKNRRLMNYVGYDGFKAPEVSDKPVELRTGDKVLLYSDGVELLTQIEMENILSRKISVQQKAEEIMRKIMNKRAKSKDNSTVIILDIR
ncbi:MAG: SpoIIE family protein phosphatase [Lachnospiraceae bacterium]|nr:SpoIIE family protein phosphatase [Lachnospiraceae bacterium]